MVSEWSKEAWWEERSDKNGKEKDQWGVLKLSECGQWLWSIFEQAGGGRGGGWPPRQQEIRKAKAAGDPHEYVRVYVYVWILGPHFDLTSLSAEEWMCVHIRMTGTADDEETFTVCGRRCRCIWTNRGKKGNGGEMEGDEKERESRSKAALCLWKREKKTWR